MSVNPTPSTRFGLIVLGVAGALAVLPATGQAQPKTQERLDGSPTKAEAQKDDTRIAAGETLPDVMYDISKLPPKVRNMLTKILGAARSGDMMAIRRVIEENELVPAFTYSSDKDPIAYWKRVSRDGEGREMLAEILKVFSSGFVNTDPGTTEELFVWPYHFVYPIDKLTPSQEVELYVLVNPEDARTMVDSGGYFGFRGAISPDGTWQYFIAGD